jgi:RNase H-fold protein (predicted Holliday junction resolvase)
VTQVVLGIDPGTRKVGFALIDAADAPALARGIEPLETLIERLRPLLQEHPIAAVALGGGTNAARIGAALAVLGAPVHIIDERDTTYRARALYFAEHPPTGWRRLLPIGLQLPPGPIDDYAAMLIARRYLACKA